MDEKEKARELLEAVRDHQQTPRDDLERRAELEEKIEDLRAQITE